jgi:tetratricopeptide (TPR) repeat protein
LDRDQTSFLGLFVITLSYAAMGKHKEAIAHAERGVELSPDLKMLRALLATVYATAGDRVGAERILDELLTRASEEYVGPTMISWIYANLDQPDRAFEWLRKACSEHDCTLAFGMSWPIYDRISEDSRFHEVVRCLHLG